jgi:aminoglycoside phosphotransferase (APT) family kinase protein
MNPSPVTLNPDETQAVLSTALRQVEGAGARLEGWTAEPLAKRGKQRVLRYALRARVPGAPQIQHYQWVGKFYDREQTAGRVATVLRGLATTDCSTRGDLVIPRVVAYHAPRRLLLLSYEPGESVIAAIAQHNGLALSAIGRALSALHSAPVALDAVTSPEAVVGDLPRRIGRLGSRFPGATVSLRKVLGGLERQAPTGPAVPSFLHGDLGPAQLLWQGGRIVVLDFDECTRGDPALDLGNLLTQLRRLTLRKPGKLPAFTSLRPGLLEAYQRWSPPDPDLPRRVAWYERVALLRKIHFLATDTTRRKGADAMRERQAEAARLLKELPPSPESDESSGLGSGLVQGCDKHAT